MALQDAAREHCVPGMDGSANAEDRREMAGGQTVRMRPGGRVVGLALLVLALGATARAQSFELASLEEPADFASSVEATESAADPLFPEPVAPTPLFETNEGLSQDPACDEPGLFDTACESLFGDAYAAGSWRPLDLGNFFSEGWREPWAGAPAGRDGLTPRHGWLASFDGVFYRLWLATFSYSNDINTSFGGNHYVGTYSIFLPLSRRFEVLFDVPFVTSNRTPGPPHSYTSQFGDSTVTPRVLLSETAAASQVLALAVRPPTGTPVTGGGITALTPRYEFWTNPGGPWVVRGAGGFFIPLDQAGTNVPNAFVGGISVGRYFTSHEAPLGDLAIYLESSLLVPVGSGSVSQTIVSVGPGTRFHIANNYFFLADVDFPISSSRPYDYNLQVALLKVF